MKTVTAKELKNRTGDVLRRVRSGETVTVTVRGVTVGRFVPEVADTQERTRRQRLSQRARIREVRGKYRGLVTVAEFLKSKAQEIELEP